MQRRSPIPTPALPLKGRELSVGGAESGCEQLRFLLHRQGCEEVAFLPLQGGGEEGDGGQIRRRPPIPTPALPLKGRELSVGGAESGCEQLRFLLDQRGCEEIGFLPLQ